MPGLRLRWVALCLVVLLGGCRPDSAATNGLPGEREAGGVMSQSNSVAPASTYSLVVKNAAVNGAQAAGPGEEILVVTAALANDDRRAVVITSESLLLVHQESDTAYRMASIPEIQPALFDLKLNAGEKIIGFAAFAVPEKRSGYALVWCPGLDYPCEDPFVGPLP